MRNEGLQNFSVIFKKKKKNSDTLKILTVKIVNIKINFS
jgi:hypothetical protein